MPPPVSVIIDETELTDVGVASVSTVHVPALHDEPSQHGRVASHGASAGRHPPPEQLGSSIAM
jgi:hypothetical protein